MLYFFKLPVPRLGMTKHAHRLMKLSLAPFLFFLTLPSALAGDPRIGEAIAAPCIVCHGERGANPIANYPILAGQHEKYLAQTLMMYKNGKRNNAVMSGLVAELTERDLRNLAAYFAEQASPLR